MVPLLVIKSGTGLSNLVDCPAVMGENADDKVNVVEIDSMTIEFRALMYLAETLGFAFILFAKSKPISSVVCTAAVVFVV